MAKKFISLTAFDLTRDHHPNDASAIIAQRAMLDAQARHNRQRSTPAIIRHAAERFSRRQSKASRTRNLETVEHPSDQQWAYFLASNDFAAFICRSLKIDVMPFEVAHWMRAMRTMCNYEIAALIRTCLPAAIDEWEQADRHGPQTLDVDDPALAADLKRLQDFLAYLERPVPAQPTQKPTAA